MRSTTRATTTVNASSSLSPVQWWRHIALVVTVLSPAIVFADDNTVGLLRRKRITTDVKSAGDFFSQNRKNKNENNKHDEKDVLWEEEAAEAEINAERILQNYLYMSLSTPPPTLGPPGFCLEGGVTREKYFLSTLSPITDEDLLLDTNSPQGQAFDWIVNKDPVFQPDPCQYPTTTQRYGLLTLYFATNGAQWTNSSGWLGDSSECTWAGVVCTGETNDRRRQLQKSTGVVYKLNLPFNNLVGTIPEEIVALPLLENLNVFANSITGGLPTSLGTLTRLIFLDVERNLLSGPLIANSLVPLQKLQALRLSRNEFTGSIPTIIGKWVDLEQFWISNNRVVGTIPTEIGNLKKLKTSFLYDNSLEGNIPSQMGALTEMSILRLDGNILEGRVPEEFFQMTNLEDLRLDGNFLSGTISTHIGRLTGLGDLRLSENLFTGNIPNQLAEVSNLKNLILFQNYLNSTIPNIFGSYSQMEHLDVSMNFLTGAIPTSIFALPAVKFVYLSNNSFIGPIPSNFQDPPGLRDLYLDGNFLSGTIPEVQPGRLQELNEALFNYNLFQGSVPQSFCNLRLDAVLDDLFTDCGGEIPEVQCEFPDCCNRCFSGERPPRRAKRTREMLR